MAGIGAGTTWAWVHPDRFTTLRFSLAQKNVTLGFRGTPLSKTQITPKWAGLGQKQCPGTEMPREGLPGSPHPRWVSEKTFQKRVTGAGVLKEEEEFTC